MAEGAAGAQAIADRAGESKSGMDAVVAIVPDNIFAAMGANDVLAVMFFALFFGVGLMLVSTPRTEALKTAIEGIFEVVMKLIGLVIQLAPFAVFCFMFNLHAQLDRKSVVKGKGVSVRVD